MVQAVADALLEQPADFADRLARPGRGGRRCRPAAAAGRSRSCHHTPRSTTRCSPWFWNVSWPSWMIRPASIAGPVLASTTASRIWSNGTTSWSKVAAAGTAAASGTPSSACRARRSSDRGSDRRSSAAVAGDDHRAVAVAHAAAAWAEGVLVEQMGVGVDADGRDFQLAAQGPAIERLDVLQLVAES